MITIFSCPKPFLGGARTAQWNAVRSWVNLAPRPEVILMGNAEGTAETCREVGAIHVRDVPSNDYGTPLINGLFMRAAECASHPVLCYVNADVMLTDRILTATQVASRALPSFLMTGRRHNVALDGVWRFSDPEWQQALEAVVARTGRLDSWIAADYFVFPKGQFLDLPPFALGRTMWDNSLLYAARKSGIPLIDATAAVLAAHQRHDYSHYEGGRAAIWGGPEAQRNRELAGGQQYAFCIADATHVLTARMDLKPALRPIYLWRRAYTLPVLHPRLWPVRRLLDGLLALSRPLRRRLGWTLGTQ